MGKLHNAIIELLPLQLIIDLISHLYQVPGINQALNLLDLVLGLHLVISHHHLSLENSRSASFRGQIDQVLELRDVSFIVLLGFLVEILLEWS